MVNSSREDYIGDMLPLVIGDYQKLQVFFESAKTQVLKKSSVIISQGAMVDKIYFLSKGKLKVSLLTDSGEEKLYWYAYPYSIFGEVPFFCRLPSNCNIITEEESAFVSYDYESFFRILYKNPSTIEFFFTTMARKIQILSCQTKNSFCDSPAVRVNKFIYSMAKQLGEKCNMGTDLNIAVTYKEIAFLTSLHRVTVTNAINNLKKEGIVSVPKRGILTVRNLEKLYELSFQLDG